MVAKHPQPQARSLASRTTQRLGELDFATPSSFPMHATALYTHPCRFPVFIGGVWGYFVGGGCSNSLSSHAALVRQPQHNALGNWTCWLEVVDIIASLGNWTCWLEAVEITASCSNSGVAQPPRSSFVRHHQYQRQHGQATPAWSSNVSSW